MWLIAASVTSYLASHFILLTFKVHVSSSTVKLMRLQAVHSVAMFTSTSQSHLLQTLRCHMWQPLRFVMCLGSVLSTWWLAESFECCIKTLIALNILLYCLRGRGHKIWPTTAMTTTTTATTTRQTQIVGAISDGYTQAATSSLLLARLLFYFMFFLSLFIYFFFLSWV